MKTSPTCYLVCLVLLLGSCRSGTEGTVSLGKYHEVDVFLQEMTREGFSGSVLISERGSVKLAKGYGLADRERKVPNTESTKFEVASITKLFTVVAILQLAEEGKISLDDRINKYLGGFPSPKDEATIHQLLLHTAGLVVRGHPLDYETKSGFLESVKNAPAESVPGEKYRYTNAGYTILAAIIEEVSQLSYENYLIENIFTPLQLGSTTFGFKDSIDELASGYTGRALDSLSLHQTPAYVWGNNGPSGIITNTSDLHLFLRGLEEQKLLNQNSLSKMFSEQMEGEAFGFHVLAQPTVGKVLARGGGLPHFESQIAWYRDADTILIILINNHLRTRQPVWDGIEGILFG